MSISNIEPGVVSEQMMCLLLCSVYMCACVRITLLQQLKRLTQLLGNETSTHVITNLFVLMLHVITKIQEILQLPLLILVTQLVGTETIIISEHVRK